MPTITLSDAQFSKLLTLLGETETMTETTAVGETSVSATVSQRPRRQNRSRRQPSAAAKTDNHRRISGFFYSKATVDAASLRKGDAFALKANGSMYTVTSVLRTATKVTLSTDHPSVEQLTLDASRQVIRCTAR